MPALLTRMSARAPARPISATKRLDRGFVGQVGRLGEAVAARARVRKPLGSKLTIFARRRSGTGRRRPRSKRFRDPAPDHAAGAGDDHALALKDRRTSSCRPQLGTGIEAVAQGVARQIDGQHEQEEAEAGEGRDPPGGRDIVAAGARASRPSSRSAAARRAPGRKARPRTAPSARIRASRRRSPRR